MFNTVSTVQIPTYKILKINESALKITGSSLKFNVIIFHIDFTNEN